MTLRNPQPHAARRRATAVCVAALGVTALAGPMPAMADAAPTPAPVRATIAAATTEPHEFDRPVSVNGSVGAVIEPVAPAIRIVLPVLPTTSAPVASAPAPKAAPALLPATGELTSVANASTVDVASLIAAKNAEFPPAAPAVIQKALANCAPAPTFSPDSNWLDIAVTLITQEEGFDAHWTDLGDGMWTIGFGHAVPKSEYATPPADIPVPLTADAAAQLLYSDLINMAYVPAVDHWFSENLPPVVFGTMVSYAYNTGPRGFEKYRIPGANLADIAEAITHASDHHADQFPGLICRRAREAALIRGAIK